MNASTEVVAESAAAPIVLGDLSKRPGPCMQETAVAAEALAVSGASDADEYPYPTGLRLFLVIVSVGAALVQTCVDMNIVATAVPSITQHFHTVADMGWYSSAYRLCMCTFQFAFGKAYTLFPVKHVFLFASSLSMTGSLLCGTAASSRMLVAGRAVAGLGAGGVMLGCFVILVRSMPLRRRPLLVGIMSAVEGGATLAAPVLGGALTQSLGWRWCFYIGPPLGAVTMALTAFCFVDTVRGSSSSGSDLARLTWKEKLSRLDLVSNLLFLPALTSLFLGLSWAGTKYPWRSAPVIILLVAFGVLLAGFAYNQHRRGDEAALLPLRIIRRRTVIAGVIFILCTNSTGNVLEYYLPTYYQAVRGYSPAKSGYLMFPIIVGATCGSLIHGAGTSAFGYYAPFMLFASTVMPVAAGLITTVRVHTSLVQIVAYTALSGLAYGIGFSGPQNAVQTVLPPDDVPIGLSVMLFAQSFGPAVSIAVAQVLFTDRLWANLHGLVPELSRTAFEQSSLTELIAGVPPAQLGEALVAVDKSLVRTWQLVVGLACTTMVGSVLMEWRSVKTKRQ